MAWYLLKIIRRDPRSVGPGRKTDDASFEAANDDEARLEAQRRANQLSPEHFVTLCDELGEMIWATERHTPEGR